MFNRRLFLFALAVAACSASRESPLAGQTTDSSPETPADASTDATPLDSRGDAPTETSGGDASSAGGDSGVLASGTTSGAHTVPCPSSPALPPGAVCTSLTVQCPGIQDIAVTVAVTTPSNATGATVLLHNGYGGQTFFNHMDLTKTLLPAGLRTVQIAWNLEWEISPAHSGLAAACRPATLLRWAFAQPHGASRTAGFCALGHSGGSGALAYALAHYGLGDTVDYAMLTAGPPFGRIDYGCDPAAYSGGPIAECPGGAVPIASSPFAYRPVIAPFLDSIEGTSTCATAGASAADVAHWAADSVVSPGASYDYPKTPVSFWYCGNAPNESTGLGWFYNSRITSAKDVHCVAGTCSGEEAYADVPTLSAMVQDLTSGCVPHH